MSGFASSLVELAAEEGRKFKAIHGREPTESEAASIADMILRQARMAIAMVR